MYTDPATTDSDYSIFFFRKIALVGIIPNQNPFLFSDKDRPPFENWQLDQTEQLGAVPRGSNQGLVTVSSDLAVCSSIFVAIGEREEILINIFLLQKKNWRHCSLIPVSSKYLKKGNERNRDRREKKKERRRLLSTCTALVFFLLRQEPLEAILVIFGRRALIFFLFESS